MPFKRIARWASAMTFGGRAPIGLMANEHIAERGECLEPRRDVDRVANYGVGVYPGPPISRTVAWPVFDTDTQPGPLGWSAASERIWRCSSTAAPAARMA